MSFTGMIVPIVSQGLRDSLRKEKDLLKYLHYLKLPEYLNDTSFLNNDTIKIKDSHKKVELPEIFNNYKIKDMDIKK